MAANGKKIILLLLILNFILLVLLGGYILKGNSQKFLMFQTENSNSKEIVDINVAILKQVFQEEYDTLYATLLGDESLMVNSEYKERIPDTSFLRFYVNRALITDKKELSPNLSEDGLLLVDCIINRVNKLPYQEQLSLMKGTIVKEFCEGDNDIISDEYKEGVRTSSSQDKYIPTYKDVTTQLESIYLAAKNHDVNKCANLKIYSDHNWSYFLCASVSGDAAFQPGNTLESILFDYFDAVKYNTCTQKSFPTKYLEASCSVHANIYKMNLSKTLSGSVSQ